MISIDSSNSRCMIEYMKYFKLVLLLILCVVLICCRKSQTYISLFDEKNALVTIGAEDANGTDIKIYKVIQEYYVDFEGNIYIGDYQEARIDKFNQKGKYLFSIGRRGQGPGEFSGTIPSFSVNSRGFLYVFSLRRRFIVFNPDGSLKEEVKFPKEFKDGYLDKIKIDYKDNVYALFSLPRKGWQIVKFNPDLRDYIVVHEGKLRPSTSLSFHLMLPDFDFDVNNNIYVTDNYDYLILVYSSAGKFIQKFDRNFKKNKIVSHDLVINFGEENRITDLSNDKSALNILKGLEGKDRFLPDIFGINVAEDRIYVWTSAQDREFKFIIDVYDKNFRFIGKRSCYNWVRKNMSIIRNKKFYIPNLGNSNIEFKKKIGRLMPYSYPYKIFV